MITEYNQPGGIYLTVSFDPELAEWVVKNEDGVTIHSDAQELEAHIAAQRIIERETAVQAQVTHWGQG